MAYSQRLRVWRAPVVWHGPRDQSLAGLQADDRIDWLRAVEDAASVRALGEGQVSAPASHERSVVPIF